MKRHLRLKMMAVFTGESPDAAFVIIRNLTLLGGYPSGGGDWNPKANPTILSGEIGETSNEDNIYQVVNIYGNDFGVTFDGVTITGGYAREISNNKGGGMFVSGGCRVTLNNVTFSYNMAVGGGGGLMFSAENLTLNHVVFSRNLASNGNGGGGIYMTNINSYGYAKGDQPLKMTDLILSGNIAKGATSALGGGVYFLSGWPYARNSSFWGNAPDQLPDGINASWCVVEGGGASGYGNIDENPMLGTLGNYGGFTQTIPLLEVSSAIDAAVDYWPVDTDQRRELRPQGAGCDMGAYEARVNLAGILIDPSGPVPVNKGIHAEAGFTCVLSGTNAYSAIWDWGDGETSEGTIDGENGIFTGSHIYPDPGVYKVSLEVSEVKESSGLSGLLKTAVYQYVVVYDPEAGFVTGGGWFDSPAGAYRDDPSMQGQATFGFVSRYKKGADVPTGNTAFDFATGGLHFQSTSYEWLVVTGSDYAKFKGSGTINGWGDFKFMVWAGDGAPDTFRIKIWDELEDTGEDVIYDNGSDQAIGGGSIVIHTK
jgi:predicted outer membrane repeat protein